MSAQFAGFMDRSRYTAAQAAQVLGITPWKVARYRKADTRVPANIVHGADFIERRATEYIRANTSPDIRRPEDLVRLEKAAFERFLG